jgi:YVTN family beta-propeller protein
VSCHNCHLVKPEEMPWSAPRTRPSAPDALAVAPDGRRLFVALGERDEVVEVEVATRRVIRRLAVAGQPAGLALSPRGDQLYVTCRLHDSVAVVDLTSGREVERAFVGLEPLGIAFGQTPQGDRLVVANVGSDDLSVLALQPLRELTRIAAGRQPCAVAFQGTNGLASVANRLSAIGKASAVPASELTVVDAGRGRIHDRQPLTSAHLAEGIAMVPKHGWTLVPIVKVRNLVPITQVANGWVMSSGLAVAGPEDEPVQLPLDEANAGFADPSGVVADPAGRRAYIASGGGDVITVVDLDRMAAWLAGASAAARSEAIDDLSLSPEYVVARISTGRNPRQLALSPDGSRLFVAERLDDSVLVVDTATLRVQGRIVLGDDDGRFDPVRRGERVFTDARYTFQQQFSCRSCHPDGHMDGLSYDFDGDGIGDNLLDNRSLRGVAGTAPFKWNGKNTSLLMQCGPRFARVLMRTDPIPPAELRDLSRFLESQPPARTVHHRQAEQPLTPAQERGRQTFFATVTPDGTPIPRLRQCQTCQRPPLYSNRLKGAVGTRAPRDTTEYFDTPHLLGIAASAPYLHDGRAQTLEELWTVYQTNNLHGVSSHMNKHQLNDLIEYLKTL